MPPLTASLTGRRSWSFKVRAIASKDASPCRPSRPATWPRPQNGRRERRRPRWTGDGGGDERASELPRRERGGEPGRGATLLPGTRPAPASPATARALSAPRGKPRRFLSGHPHPERFSLLRLTGGG